MSKVFLGVGHGGKDPGAVGYLKEADVNLTMALACRDYLVANGVEVKMSRTRDENDDLQEEINECNAYKPDLAIDIHNNAGGGDGFEVYYGIAGVGKPLAENIEKEVIAIGQNSRGLKTKLNSKGNADYFGFIRLISCPSVIVEGVFVDNANDAAQADTIEEQQAFGVAYAKGILKTLGITTENVPQPTKPASNDKTEIIRKLQHAYNVSYNAGLVEDGIKGLITEGVMKKYPIRNYKANELARWVQDRLVNHKGYWLVIDGKYGKQTEAVVKQFQRDNKIVVDGIAGHQTISILI